MIFSFGPSPSVVKVDIEVVKMIKFPFHFMCSKLDGPRNNTSYVM